MQEDDQVFKKKKTREFACEVLEVTNLRRKMIYVNFASPPAVVQIFDPRALELRAVTDYLSFSLRALQSFTEL